VRDLARYRELIKVGSTTQQTLDTQASLVQQLQGTVASDQGSVQNLEVQVSYCTITSPVDGVVGLRLVDPGNYVTTTATTGIAVITQMTPATVVFAVPEDDLGAINQAMAKGAVTVLAYDRNKHNLLATGALLALDNQVDTSTGTIKVKAQFDDSGKALFPNQFVNARLKADTLTQITVVPTRAIQHGSNGDFVFVVVDPGNYVTTASTTGIAVITQMTPATVVFAVPEDDLGAINQAMAKGAVTVLAYDRNKHNLLGTGSLLALDNQVDTSTGTIKVKAQFDDSGKALFPNQFVNARLKADTLTQITVVPTRAIQHGSKGDFVFVVVDPGNKVSLRNVKTGPATGDVSAILDNGVKQGEQVVTEGADKLDDGSAVKVVTQ